MMPKLDGIEVVRRLKADPTLPFIPVILVTAKADAKDIVAGLEAGADDYLTKPVDQAALLARVRSMLRIKGLHDTVQEQATRSKPISRAGRWNRDARNAGRGAARRDRAHRPAEAVSAAAVAEMIVARGDDRILETHRRDIVVVFCDLRGFTAFAETAEPEEVMELLREYHGAVGRWSSRSEGTLEHFSGDGIMVFFNDPLPCPDPAERAAAMAVAMRQAVARSAGRMARRGRESASGSASRRATRRSDRSGSPSGSTTRRSARSEPRGAALRRRRGRPDPRQSPHHGGNRATMSLHISATSPSRGSARPSPSTTSPRRRNSGGGRKSKRQRRAVARRIASIVFVTISSTPCAPSAALERLGSPLSPSPGRSRSPRTRPGSSAIIKDVSASPAWVPSCRLNSRFVPEASRSRARSGRNIRNRICARRRFRPFAVEPRRHRGEVLLVGTVIADQHDVAKPVPSETARRVFDHFLERILRRRERAGIAHVRGRGIERAFRQ